MTNGNETAALTAEQISILRHTRDRAANGNYCGDSEDMQALVDAGLMEFAGRVPGVPDDYFRMTPAGKRMLQTIETSETH